MPQTQDTDENVAPVGDLAPRTAGTHVSLLERTEPVVTDRRSIWPFAPWRLVLVMVAIGTAIVCGPPAADPATGINGADLGVGISLVTFVAAFALPSPRRKDTR